MCGHHGCRGVAFLPFRALPMRFYRPPCGPDVIRGAVQHFPAKAAYCSIGNKKTTFHNVR